MTDLRGKSVYLRYDSANCLPIVVASVVTLLDALLPVGTSITCRIACRISSGGRLYMLALLLLLQYERMLRVYRGFSLLLRRFDLLSGYVSLSATLLLQLLHAYGILIYAALLLTYLAISGSVLALPIRVGALSIAVQSLPILIVVGPALTISLPVLTVVSLPVLTVVSLPVLSLLLPSIVGIASMILIAVAIVAAEDLVIDDGIEIIVLGPPGIVVPILALPVMAILGILPVLAKFIAVIAVHAFTETLTVTPFTVAIISEIVAPTLLPEEIADDHTGHDSEGIDCARSVAAVLIAIIVRVISLVIRLIAVVGLLGAGGALAGLNLGYLLDTIGCGHCDVAITGIAAVIVHFHLDLQVPKTARHFHIFSLGDKHCGASGIQLLQLLTHFFGGKVRIVNHYSAQPISFLISPAIHFAHYVLLQRGGLAQ